MADAMSNIYLANQAVLNEYWRSAMGAMSAMEPYLPRTPLDVDAKVYVELGDRDFDNRDDATLALADFIAELQELGAKAPKGAEVVIELGSGGYDGDEYATYEVGYFRAPNSEERAEREETNRKIAEREAKRADESAAKERAEFERLKEKFG